MRFPNGKAKAVTYSCDDGRKQDKITSAILSEYNLKGTFNLNGEKFNSGFCLTKEEVEEFITTKGHEIAIHGYNHRAPGATRAIEGIKEILDLRIELEQNYKQIIKGMAYPDFGVKKFFDGINYETIRGYLSDLEIVYARTTGFDNNKFEMPTDWYNWTPSVHQKNPQMLEFARDFASIDVSKYSINRQEPRLFYVWGHSVELEDENVLKMLKNTFECIANKEDTWYATNIEIYNYTKAYNSLEYSADGLMVYNPTLYQIWFSIDGKEYSIKSGETIKI